MNSNLIKKFLAVIFLLNTSLCININGQSKISINVGGSVVESFKADKEYNGGMISSNWNGPIDLSSFIEHAPEEIYKSERFGDFSYVFNALKTKTRYKVRLHFCENYFTRPDSRMFNVLINGNQVLTNYDIISSVGAIHKADVQEFITTSDNNKKITIAFKSIVNKALLNGIEIIEDKTSLSKDLKNSAQKFRMEKDTLITYPIPDNSLKANEFEVKVNNIPIDLYGSRTRYGNICSFGYFDFSGEVIITVKANYPASHESSINILPARLNIETKSIGNGQIEFKLTKPQQLTFILNNDYIGSVLHLFANAPDIFKPLLSDTNIIYYKPGYHKIGKEKNYTIELKNGKTLYIAGGAYIEGTIHAENAKNIKICGRGILAQPRMSPMGEAIRLDDCSDVEIQGIIVNKQNTNGWTTIIARSKNIKIENYKGVSTPIWSSDGIDIVNCQNVLISHSFIRAGDDDITIKGLGKIFSWDSEQNPKDALPNENIMINGVTAWSDNNNAFVVGQETIAKYYKNIHFKNCDILFARDEEPIKSAMSIICMHGTEMEDISYEDISVGPCGHLISVFFTEGIFGIKTNQRWKGKISNVLYKNISAYESGSKTIRIDGFDESKLVENIELDNIMINEKKIDVNSSLIKKNKFVHELIVK